MHGIGAAYCYSQNGVVCAFVQSAKCSTTASRIQTAKMDEPGSKERCMEGARRHNLAKTRSIDPYAAAMRLYVKLL